MIRVKAPLAGLALVLYAGNAAAESLQQAWDAAQAVDRTLKASHENIAAASEQLAAAKSSRLPSLMLEGGRTATDETPAIKTGLLGQPMQIPVSQRYSTAYQAMATLPLYTSGRIGRGIDAAAASVDAAKLSSLGEVQNLKLRVAEAYVGVLRADSMLKVADSHVQSLEAHQHDVENLHGQGLVAQSDRLSANVALADARQQLLQVANALELARAAYNRILARPLDQPVQLDEISPESSSLPLEDLSEAAQANRSELATMGQQIKALHRQASAVRSENGPQIAVSGGYVYQENRYQLHEDQWTVTLGARWNLFDGGVVSHRAGAIKRQAAALSEQRDEWSSLIGLEVRQAWLDHEETTKRVEVTRSAVAQAEENLRVVRDRYANGLSSHTEVLDAETLRVNSEANQARALFDAALAGLRLKRAAGEL